MVSNEPPPITLLFVPGHRESMLEKARNLPSDAVIFDLEDSVPPDQKDTARTAVAKTLRGWPDTGVPQPYVRVHAPKLGMLANDTGVLAANRRTGVVVPKVERPVELLTLRDEPDINGRNMLVIIETARSLFHLEAFADAPGVDGLCIGGEDLSVSLGLRGASGGPLDIAAALIVAAARASGVAAYGSICPEFRDTEVIRRDAERTVAAGFDGKLAIHPAQIPIIEEAFRPPADLIAWAREAISAFDAADVSGQGAVQVHGQMVDQPVADRARAILNLASRLPSGDHPD